MCGFSGFVGQPLSRQEGSDRLERMASALQKRGPDGQGIWLREDVAVGLAHRRLAVVGLGSDGQQPMRSTSGRWIVAYNGEIYNFPDLRKELIVSGVSFRGGSDTEVLLAAIEAWGLVRALERLVGMFAFALWDDQEQVLHLARDRFGEKPLYCGWQNDTFLFGSDLAALRQHPDWVGGLDRRALALFVQHNYVPAPFSIHPGIRKLGPGLRLELAFRGGRWKETEARYWSASHIAAQARARSFRGSLVDASEALHEMLRATVAGQMLSEVPLGAFLSGGVDSSMVVSLMQSSSATPVRTFTVGFADSGYDESAHAGRIARHLGTRHHEWILEPEDALALIPGLAETYTEPFADASQVATALVCRMAREEVTVALSGDGGDEVFGGYNRYVWGESLWKYSRSVPAIARRFVRHAIKAVSPQAWDGMAVWLPGRGLRQPGEKLHKLAGFLGAASPPEAYGSLTGFWHEGNPVGTAAPSAEYSAVMAEVWNGEWSMAESMMLSDTFTYLPDDILVKVDRAAMGVSLETRVPFLDHRLFEFVWSLPAEYRISEGRGKNILRRLLDRYVPSELIDRPKSGFALPIHDWLRGPLRDWAEYLIDESRLRQEGVFDSVRVRCAWKEHLSGQRNRQYDLWSILMFQAWQDKWA